MLSPVGLKAVHYIDSPFTMRNFVLLVLACAVAVSAMSAPNSGHYRWTLEVMDADGNKEVVKGKC